MRRISAIKALADQVAGWVHPSVAHDSLPALAHRSFIAAHLTLGVVPFAALPVALAFGDALDGVEAAALGWLLAPILIALHLAKTGALARASLLSAASLALCVGGLAAATGGLASPLLLLLVLAAVEGGLSGSRRTAAAAAAMSLAAAAGVAIGEAAGVWPTAAPVGLFAAIVMGLLAVTMVLRVALVMRAAFGLGRIERDRFDRLAGAVGDLVTRHGPDGGVVFVSPSATSLLGVTARELLGQGLFQRIHVADRPAFLRALSEDGPGDTDIRVRRGAFDAPAVAADYAPLAMRVAADAAGAVATFRNLTDVRAGQEELRAARAAADGAAAAADRVLATVSHELKTPLNAIVGFSEILAGQGVARPDAERREAYAALIHQAGRHMLEVVDGVLEMARLDGGRIGVAPEAIAAAPVVAESVGMLARQAEERGVRLIADVGADLPPLMADRRALMQILLNLLSNALKFTPRGGQVMASLAIADGALQVTVRDTGCGVAVESLDRLGEPFFQIARGAGQAREGAGLGLSVVRALTHAHGGRLSFHSAPGQGLRVTVALPLAGSDRREDFRRAPVEAEQDDDVSLSFKVKRRA